MVCHADDIIGAWSACVEHVLTRGATSSRAARPASNTWCYQQRRPTEAVHVHPPPSPPACATDSIPPDSHLQPAPTQRARTDKGIARVGPGRVDACARGRVGAWAHVVDTSGARSCGVSLTTQITYPQDTGPPDSNTNSNTACNSARLSPVCRPASDQ